MSRNEMQELLTKYDVPVPRYTSYPTVPFWEDSPTTEEWIGSLNNALAKPETTWSMYIHIPYCESLCTFCGCNTSITRNHDREAPYVKLIHTEWEKYKKANPGFLTKALKQIHLGGGTPTFLSAENLVALVKPILDDCVIDLKDFEASIEVDPRRTTSDQLEALYEIGFKRVSLGVQDFSSEVQKLINRYQPLSITQNLTSVARNIGYDSINYDLIYGLPKQTLDGFAWTVDKTIELKPDRIALYSFALVPWIKPAQRLFKDSDLPVGAEKRALYEMAREKFLHAGYIEIGIDHFALPTDALNLANEAGKLHRNFMGYTEHRTDIMLGLGVSSISESPDCFHQNEKVFPVYEKAIQEGVIPTLRGHKLNSEDQARREQILKFMTCYKVELEDVNQLAKVSEVLKELIDDQLVEVKEMTLSVTEKGKPFIRNACMALDERLFRKAPGSKVFSQAM